MAGNGVVIRDAAVVTARPVVPGPVAEPQPPYALAGGSQLNRYAIGGPYAATELGSGSSLDKAQSGSWWVPIINGATKFFNSWRPNMFREISTHNVAGNYGAMTSTANFGFLGREFPVSFAGMPDDVIRGNRSEWNNLVPIIWGLRVVNPVANLGNSQTVNPQSVVSQFTESAEFTPGGSASLSMKGEVLQ